MKQSKSIKLVFVLFVFSLFISNCVSAPHVITAESTVSLTPAPTSTFTPVIPTYSPADIATISAETYPLPTAPQSYATPFPPFGNQHYTYSSIRFIGKYVIRDWHDPFTDLNAITIAKVGQPQIALEERWLYVDELTGIDVINEGFPIFNY
ncbi:MAG: hypothetical protein QM730_08310 [Anaerolineales bacterium]